jgi:uncharacterized membrane protein YqjE
VPEQGRDQAREPGAEQPGPGLLQSLRNLATTLVALLQTRLELLAADLEEGGVRLLQILFLAVGALLFLILGALILTFLAVLLLWQDQQVSAIVGLAVAFLVIGGGLAFAVRNRVRAGPRMFSGTVGELAKDRERLGSR